MIFGKKESGLRKAMAVTGKQIREMRLVAGSSGNLSVRLDENNILITATGSLLGHLKQKDVMRVNISSHDAGGKPVTSEFPLHRLIHQNFPGKAVVHCHPALVNGYFAVYSDIKVLTFEGKLFLSSVPVVVQETPAVSKPEQVIDALKASNIVMLKNHGVISIGDNFRSALNLIEMLEEAVRTAGLARIFKKDILDDLDKELKEDFAQGSVYPMFSREHIQAIVDLVNQDEFIAQKGCEMDLTVQLAICLDGAEKVFKFNFEKGKIIRLDTDAQAPFVISAPAGVWQQVFLGKLDSFVAVTQGKMKLKGEMGKLSRWYVPFSRLFELFKKVKITT